MKVYMLYTVDCDSVISHGVYSSLDRACAQALEITRSENPRICALIDVSGIADIDNWRTAERSYIEGVLYDYTPPSYSVTSYYVMVESERTDRSVHTVANTATPNIAVMEVID